LGSALNAAKPEGCTADCVLSQEQDCRASRLHQEDKKDNAGGSRPRETAEEPGDEMKKKNSHIGSSLDNFLIEEGILEETRAAALKEVLAWQVQKAMKRKKINKVEMARRMKTSRAALDRLLDPANASVTLQTLCKAARAIGRGLRIDFV
jgi:antitoxin HicB